MGLGQPAVPVPDRTDGPGRASWPKSPAGRAQQVLGALDEEQAKGTESQT